MLPFHRDPLAALEPVLVERTTSPGRRSSRGKREPRDEDFLGGSPCNYLDAESGSPSAALLALKARYCSGQQTAQGR